MVALEEELLPLCNPTGGEWEVELSPSPIDVECNAVVYAESGEMELEDTVQYGIISLPSPADHSFR